MRASLFSFSILLLLTGCGSGEPAPAGYVEACYGGDFTGHLAGRGPFISADVAIPESDWPRLADLMQVAATQRGVKFFNDTRHNDGLSMILISLCSSDGIYLTADKRIWHNAGAKHLPDDPILITAYAYKNDETWKPFAIDLIRELKREWPDRVIVPSKRTSTLKTSLL